MPVHQNHQRQESGASDGRTFGRRGRQGGAPVNKASSPALECGGRADLGRITQLHHNHDRELVDLTITDQHGRASVVHTTPHHPFWDESQNGWTEAGMLAVGDRLHTGTRDTALVTRLDRRVGPQWMYDLTVDVVHTYRIGAGGSALLVHNENCPVSAYEVGTYSELKARSPSGDGHDIHHVPQKHPAEQVIPGYEAKDGPAIALPAAEHKQVPRSSGNYPGTAQDLLDGDIANLRSRTNAPEEAIEELLDLNKRTYPGSFGGGN